MIQGKLETMNEVTTPLKYTVLSKGYKESQFYKFFVRSTRQTSTNERQSASKQKIKRLLNLLRN